MKEKQLELLEKVKNGTLTPKQAQKQLLGLFSVIGRLNDMRPDIEELEEFDHNRKDDYVYCIEWGMKKQKWIEQAVYDRTLDDLNALQR